jgi:hypothetical protein
MFHDRHWARIDGSRTAFLHVSAIPSNAAVGLHDEISSALGLQIRLRLAIVAETRLI